MCDHVCVCVCVCVCVSGHASYDGLREVHMVCYLPDEVRKACLGAYKSVGRPIITMFKPHVIPTEADTDDGASGDGGEASSGQRHGAPDSVKRNAGGGAGAAAPNSADTVNTTASTNDGSGHAPPGSDGGGEDAVAAGVGAGAGAGAGAAVATPVAAVRSPSTDVDCSMGRQDTSDVRESGGDRSSTDGRAAASNL